MPHKIRVKLGQFEFDAEGTESVVNEQFAMFLEVAKAGATQAKSGGGLPPGTESGGGSNGAGNEEPLSKDVMDRVFMVDDQDMVSLRILPKSQQREADGVLALLFGFRSLANQMDVLSGRLLAAATQSGLSIDRIDRALAPHMQLITKGGTRSGSRYGLNNRGLAQAQQIIRGMLD